MWNRVTINRAAHKSTRYYIDEMHLLLKEEQTAAYTVEIWKRFRKWGGIPTGITQNVKDLLSSREVEDVYKRQAAEYIPTATRNGWIVGYPDGQFHGEDEITRAEVVTIINRMLGRTADETFIRRNEDNLITCLLYTS